MKTTFAIMLTVSMAAAPTSLSAAESGRATTRIADIECVCGNHPATELPQSAAFVSRRVNSPQQTTAQPQPMAKVGGRVSRKNLVIVGGAILAFWILVAIQPET